MRRVIDREAAMAAVKEIYEDLAKRSVERDCALRTGCCQFKLTGKTPYLTAGEAQYAANALRAIGRTKLQDKPDGSCPLLDPNGRCIIYDSRPFGCRTHFCAAAGGDYPRRSVVDLIHRLEDLDYALGGAGPQSLPAALKEALQEPLKGNRKVLSMPKPRARGRG